MRFASWLWDWSEFARAPFVRLWDAVVAIASAAISQQISNFKTMGSAIAEIWNGAIEAMTRVATGWGDAVVAAWSGISQAFSDYLVDPIRSAWAAVVGWMRGSFEGIVSIAQRAWQAIAGGLSAAFRGVLQFIASRIDTVAGLINRLIEAFNALPGPDIPLIPMIGEIELFAQGGVVSSPTLAMVGEGGEDEYIIPASKMQAASSRFLGGARGSAVIPSGSGRSGSATSAPQLNITTGPVMQQQDGSRWVSMDDFEQGLQQVTDQLIGTLRTPQARIALGAG
jgi:hypothetical protein